MIPATAWYREAEVLLLVLLVAGVYFARFDQPSLRGEETRWATCAWEHLRTGDWIVARQQGQVHADRPPLVNWLMAGGMVLLGADSVLAVRLPSLLATLATTLLIYAYGRLFLLRGGALAAASAFATMIQVMSLGRLAESDAVLTLFVAASMLVWHYGYVRQWPKTAVWCSSYLLTALAALAKGPQGPIYFAGAVTVYLLLVRRDWRYFLHPAHLLGSSVCVATIGLWAVPYYLATDWQAVYLTWGNQAASRFTLSEPGRLLTHLATFPLEVLGCMLPWSLLLAVYLKRDFWRKLDNARSHAIFLVTAITISLLPVWICQGARNRYCMPFYPCAALLVGLAIDAAGNATLEAVGNLPGDGSPSG